MLLPHAIDQGLRCTPAVSRMACDPNHYQLGRLSASLSDKVAQIFSVRVHCRRLSLEGSPFR